MFGEGGVGTAVLVSGDAGCSCCCCWNCWPVRAQSARLSMEVGTICQDERRPRIPQSSTLFSSCSDLKCKGVSMEVGTICLEERWLKMPLGQEHVIHNPAW